MDCAICFKGVDHPVSHEGCPALFCKGCLRTWAGAQHNRGLGTSCPVCRKAIDDVDALEEWQTSAKPPAVLKPVAAAPRLAPAPPRGGSGGSGAGAAPVPIGVCFKCGKDGHKAIDCHSSPHSTMSRPDLGPNPGGPHLLFVANVERSSVSAAQLRTVLEQAGGGQLVRLDLQPDLVAGGKFLHSGKGICTFASAAAAARAAAALNQQLLAGRPVLVSYIADLPSTLRQLHFSDELAASIRKTAAAAARGSLAVSATGSHAKPAAPSTAPAQPPPFSQQQQLLQPELPQLPLLEKRDEKKRTELALACKNGGERAFARAKELIAAGADVNAADYRGMTPLHLAVRDGADAFAVLLLENSADPTVPDGDGHTAIQMLPFYYARRGAYDYSMPRFTALLRGMGLLSPKIEAAIEKTTGRIESSNNTPAPVSMPLPVPARVASAPRAWQSLGQGVAQGQAAQSELSRSPNRMFAAAVLAALAAAPAGRLKIEQLAGIPEVRQAKSLLGGGHFRELLTETLGQRLQLDKCPGSFWVSATTDGAEAGVNEGERQGQVLDEGERLAQNFGIGIDQVPEQSALAQFGLAVRAALEAHGGSLKLDQLSKDPRVHALKEAAGAGPGGHFRHTVAAVAGVSVTQGKTSGEIFVTFAPGPAARVRLPTAFTAVPTAAPRISTRSAEPVRIAQSTTPAAPYGTTLTSTSFTAPNHFQVPQFQQEQVQPQPAQPQMRMQMHVQPYNLVPQPYAPYELQPEPQLQPHFFPNLGIFPSESVPEALRAVVVRRLAEAGGVLSLAALATDGEVRGLIVRLEDDGTSSSMAARFLRALDAMQGVQRTQGGVSLIY